MWRIDRTIAVAAIRRGLLACCLALLAPASSYGQCVAPEYRAGRVLEDSASTVLATVSMPLSDFAPGRLVCLAAALMKQYLGRTRITILVFSSEDAARYYHGDVQAGDFGPPKNAIEAMLQDATWSAKQLHALYSYDAGKREEYIALKPLGFSSALPHDTRITLPVVMLPSCRLEVRDRCLLALDTISYAAGAYQAKMSGSVTLAGTITRDGSITRIEVVEATSVRSGATNRSFATPSTISGRGG